MHRNGRVTQTYRVIPTIGKFGLSVRSDLHGPYPGSLLPKLIQIESLEFAN
jgi:hypothetical protein